MCVYLALVWSLLRGILHRLLTDLIDWVLFKRRFTFNSVNITQYERNYDSRPWFHRVDRRRGQQLVERGGDGCFLVRPSTKHMMTLSLWYRGRAYNIPIRKRADGQYSLGTSKPNERVFLDLDEIVQYFSTHEDLILFSRGVQTGRCRLLYPAALQGYDTYTSLSEEIVNQYMNWPRPTNQYTIVHM